MSYFNDLPARFQHKIVIEPNTNCWLWIGALAHEGYGYVKVSGRGRGAHRAIYEMFQGPVPLGKELDHVCRTRCCCNPSHLEPVSHAVNVKRAVEERDRSVCAHGHPLSGHNLYVYANGARSCRTCRRDHIRRHRAKMRLTNLRMIR